MHSLLKSSTRLTLILLFLFFAVLLSDVSLAKPKKVPRHPPPESQISTPPSVHFFSFGDWGDGSKNQKAVADELQKVCEKSRCDFGITLGDNFYNWGVSSVDDELWQTRFRDYYSRLKVPFYATLGNHDEYGSVKAQIDFSKKDEYWRMPGRYYSFRYPEKGDPLVEIFVLDSVKFLPESQTWLAKALDESKARWKILAFHYPILNIGTRHPSDQAKMWPWLQPIVCGKIDLILSGHEHIFAHLKDTADTCGWDQVIIGTGGAGLYGIKTNHPPNLRVLYAEANYGLGFFEVTPKEMTLHFYRAEGDESYHYTWKKP